MSYDHKSLVKLSYRILKQGHNLISILGVESSGRLIGKYKCRSVGKCPGYGNSLLLSTGQPAGRYGSNKSESEGFGIASLVLGIITVLLFCTCISWITGILAIIFGIIQLVKGNKKGMAIVGLITGGIGFAASIILYILIFFTGLGSYSSYNDIYDHIYDDIYDDIEDSMDDGTI